jgi:hypothetical protein
MKSQKTIGIPRNPQSLGSGMGYFGGGQTLKGKSTYKESALGEEEIVAEDEEESQGSGRLESVNETSQPKNDSDSDGDRDQEE